MRSIATIEIDPIRFATDTRISFPLMVCAHERSGSHFLINSIADNSLYRNDPRLDYDVDPLGTFHNFHDVNSTRSFFRGLAAHKCASIVKSHFPADFFIDEEGNFLLDGLCKVLYVTRNPIDVMLSFHRYIKTCSWNEGPKTTCPIEFFRASPQGRMLRYQKCSSPLILERWKQHFLGWHRLAKAHRVDILLVNYHDLDLNHEAETRRVLAFLGCVAPKVVVRPDRVNRTIYVPPGPPIPCEEHERIRKEIVERIGPCEAIEETFPNLYG